tara:strand:- start:17617 stop:18600 length:984 start_codon:yes stop_codon:yes gene_type:complete
MDPRLAQALIGAAPEDNSPEQLAIAQALAQQNRWGNLMSMSGDRALAPAGGAMVKNVAGQREGLQKARQGQADRAAQEADWREKNRLKELDIQATKELAEARLAATAAQQEHMNIYREEGRTIAADARLDKNTQLLSKQLDKTGIPRLGDSLDAFNRQMDEMEIDPEDPEIPGVGGIQNVPFIGAVFGGASGRKLRQQFQGLANALIVVEAGKNVTANELERKLKEYGLDLTSSDEEFVTAHQNLNRLYDRVISNVLGGYAGKDGKTLLNYEDQFGTFYRMGDHTEKYRGPIEQSALERPPNIPEEEWAVLLKTLSPEELQAIAGAE